MGETTITVPESLADELYNRKTRKQTYAEFIWELLDKADHTNPNTETLNRVQQLKQPGESFDDVVNRLLDVYEEDGRMYRGQSEVLREWDRDRLGSSDDPEAEPAEEPTETDTEATVTTDLPDELNEIDVFARGDEHLAEQRRAAIGRMYRHLRDEGTATKDDFLEHVDGDALGYKNDESLWSNLIKGQNTLAALPGVQSHEGRPTWRYVPEDDGH